MDINPVEIHLALEQDIGSQYSGFEHLSADSSCTVVAKSLLYSNLLKKLVTEVAPDADQLALKKFLACNDHCREHIRFAEWTGDEVFDGTLRRNIYNFVNRHGFELINHVAEIFSVGDVGPGSSIGASGNDFYTKLFGGPISSTDASLYTMYKAYFSSNPAFALAESRRAERYGEARIVKGNRISFVPKRDDVSRTIATEPTLNMVAQKGIGEILTRRLKSFFGIDLKRQQQCNRDLARTGSTDGSYATIDLSSASDTISVSLVEWLFQGTQLLNYMRWCRSPEAQLPDGTHVALQMWSTMGNGYTFPLQTCIFASVVVTCAELARFPLSKVARSWTEVDDDGNFTYGWAVNGDDIVVPTQLYPDVMRALKRLGFLPNPDKSFSTGLFRESCGGDYFRGRDVRSAYFTRLRTPQDIYIAINKVNLWSSKTGVALPALSKLLLKHVPYRPVPMHFPIYSGIRTPLEFVKQGVHLDRNGSYRFSAWVPRPSRWRFNDDGVPCSPKRFDNPSGALLAFLHGNVNAGYVTVRKDVDFRLTRVVCPNWDTPDPLEHNSSYWRGWNSPVLINMRVRSR